MRSSHGRSARAVQSMEPPPSATAYSFEDAVFRMFQDEWRRQRGTGYPTSSLSSMIVRKSSISIPSSCWQGKF